jgi:hypothetical protein
MWFGASTGVERQISGLTGQNLEHLLAVAAQQICAVAHHLKAA